MADLLFSPSVPPPPASPDPVRGGRHRLDALHERAHRPHWERHRFYQNINRDVRPSELFSRHITGCFISDTKAIANRHAIGIDHITWESDYPHSDSSWPNSRDLATMAFQDVPDEEVRSIVELNARRPFNFS
jgi:hypothetical protein